MPASNYDPVYVSFACRRLGAAAGRALGQDVRVLERVVTSHDALARLQLLAWLFDGTEQAVACAQDDLTMLDPASVAEPALLRGLQRAGPAVEVLRCAALLELDPWSALPAEDADVDGLQAELDRVVTAAPHLGRCRVQMVRALRLRGRVRGRDVWVGAPCASLGLSSAHAAWQAAHEATVAEVGEGMAAVNRAPTFSSLEGVALVLLAERASEAGLAADHAGWLTHLSRPPATQRCHLGPEDVAVLQRCRNGLS